MPAKYRLAVGLAVVGLVLVGGYWGSRALGIGKIGEPTDIGGGAILLLGYIVLFTAVLTGIAARRR